MGVILKVISIKYSLVFTGFNNSLFCLDDIIIIFSSLNSSSFCFSNLSLILIYYLISKNLVIILLFLSDIILHIL